MPTPKKGPRLASSPAHERLMLANMATSLFMHGRITTTLPKAKRLRPLAERLITFAKRGDLHSRRRVMPRQSFDNVLKSFCPPDQNEPSARAGWNSIVRIDNLDNHFQPPVLIRGEPLSPALKLWDEKEN